jgi:hypothetical protein
LTTLLVDIAGPTSLLVDHPSERALHVVQCFMSLVTDVRGRLAAGCCNVTCGAGPGVAARMSLTTGQVVIGAVGSSAHPAIALVGPSVSVGARLLKHVHPGGIIASANIVTALRDDAPELAKTFRLGDRAFEVPGRGGLHVETYQAADCSDNAWGGRPSDPKEGPCAGVG